jgi:uncharacterized membrane protein YjjB (DUF3815 family)
MDSNMQSVQEFTAAFDPIYAAVESVGLRVEVFKHLCMSHRLLVVLSRMNMSPGIATFTAACCVTVFSPLP